MTKYLFILCCLSASAVSAQTTSPVEEVVAAELAFAKAAKDKNTRAAFIESFAKDGIVISKGEFVNAIELWQKFPEDSALLAWWPVFADVDISGELGYTTGPYEFYPDRNGSSPVGFGYYSTVWKKEDGKWKAACDMGISLRQSDSPPTSVTFAKSAGTSMDVTTATEYLRTAEQSYTTALNATTVSFLPAYFATEFRLHRPSAVPVTTKEALETFDEQNKQFTFEPVHLETSSAGDMAFTYGNVSIELMRDGNKRTLPGNYMRVWKNINGEWKIVLDVISVG